MTLQAMLQAILQRRIYRIAYDIADEITGENIDNTAASNTDSKDAVAN
jgi:hypothetical protein